MTGAYEVIEKGNARVGVGEAEMNKIVTCNMLASGVFGKA